MAHIEATGLCNRPAVPGQNRKRSRRARRPRKRSLTGDQLDTIQHLLCRTYGQAGLSVQADRHVASERDTALFTYGGPVIRIYLVKRRPKPERRIECAVHGRGSEG